MNNPQSYVNHQLNTSATKQTFSFSRAERFKTEKRSAADTIYEQPSWKTNRSCSFGYGTKISLVQKEKSPPPGTYYPSGEFDQKGSRYNTISFSLGRNKVKFGSFLQQSFTKKSYPGPNAYRIKPNSFNAKGGRMAAKLPTQIQLIAKKKSPGPGQYSLDITEMGNSGSYVLSNYANNLSPKYSNNINQSRTQLNNKSKLGPGQYSLANENFSKSITSKFNNSANLSFGKEKRPGLDDKTKKHFPGFKYKRFSQFVGQN